MDFSIKAFNTKNAIAQHKSSCIAVGVYEGGKLSFVPANESREANAMSGISASAL